MRQGHPPDEARTRRWLPRLTRLSLGLKLAFIAAAATAVVLAGMAFLTVRFFRSQLLSVITEASSTESDALRIVLEEQMMAGDRKLLRRLIADVGRESGIEWIGVVDREGRVQVSSSEKLQGQKFETSAPECHACHSVAPSRRLRSAALVRPDGGVLRTVTPMVNREPCQRCHGSDHRLNGVLIIDRTLSPLQSAIATSRTQVLVGSAAALFALMASLGFAVERLVLARLRRLRKAARLLGQGEIDTRAMGDSPDELGDLARDFNAMADRLAAAMAGLSNERKQLDDLVNGIADGIVLVDTGLNVVTMNRAFAALLPDGAPGSPGTPYRDLVRGAGVEIAPAARMPAERALTSRSLEKAVVRLSASPKVTGEPGTVERVGEMYAQPLFGADGAVAAIIEVWRDITDRAALEASLEHSERLASLGIIASSIAHEVGNPLASIATAVEGLLQRLNSEEGAKTAELREYLEIVRDQVFRCHGVTQRLLSFARASSSELTSVDAAKAARDVLALVAHQARSQKVEIASAITAPAFAAAEDMMLEMVLLNLVLNALRVMPSGGVLGVELDTGADTVSITVTDTGPGIPEAMRHHLFEPFRRGQTEGTGTGLGLFLSQNLVRRCGGVLTARNTTGKGAAFTVQLKRAPIDQAATGDGAIRHT